jgi:hypothetical protein
MPARASLTILALAACSHHSAPQDAYPGTNIVSLHSPSPPKYAAYRDGMGPWLIPTADVMGNFTLHVGNDYQWVVACTVVDGSFMVELGGATFADGATQNAICSGSPAMLPTFVTVTGQMAEAGEVQMRGVSSSQTPNWAYSLTVPLGTHELVAIDAANNMVLRRDQKIVQSVSLPAIDTAQGTAMVPVMLTVNGLGSDTLVTSSTLFTGNDTAVFMGTTPTVQTAPPSLLVGSDVQRISVTAENATAQREVTTTFSGTETTFDLPPVLSGISYANTGNVLDAAFGTLPPYDRIESVVDQLDAPFGEVHVIVSKSWVAATGATELAFDQMLLPGFDPVWTIDPSKSYDRKFVALGSSGTFTWATAVIDPSSPH